MNSDWIEVLAGAEKGTTTYKVMEIMRDRKLNFNDLELRESLALHILGTADILSYSREELIHVIQKCYAAADEFIFTTEVFKETEAEKNALAAAIQKKKEELEEKAFDEVVSNARLAAKIIMEQGHGNK